MKLTISSVEDMQALVEKLSSLPFDKGQTYEVSYKRKIRKRSVPQNRLYWLWLSCIADETGHDSEDLHRVFAGKYLTCDVIEVMGEKVRKIPSTTTLSTQTFTEYIEKIRIYAATELGLTLPDPEDRFFEQFEEYYSRQ